MSIDLLINKIQEKMANKDLLSIFDRDGTLVPFHPQPEKAVFSESDKQSLKDLSHCSRATVGILSARDLTQLSHDFNREDLILAGNYGMEISFPSRETFINETAKSYRPLLSAAIRTIEQNIPQAANIILEDHELTLCLHWHLTPQEYLRTVDDIVDKIRLSIPQLIIRCLPTSYEIWPPIKWDKAYGLAEIERILQIDWANYLPLYAGDSKSDEIAFEWVNDHQGISICVGNRKETNAQFRIESPVQMAEFLKKLVTLMNILVD